VIFTSEKKKWSDFLWRKSSSFSALRVMSSPIMTTEPMQCVIADTPETRTQVYRLRYRCYRANRAVSERTDKQFRDSFDDKPNSFSFLVHNEAAEPLATVRVTVVVPNRGWRDSPASRVYAGDPEFEAVRREFFAEANRLCFGSDSRSESFIRLVGNMGAVAEYYGVEWLVACPRVEHVMVYRRLFGFRPLADPRRCVGVASETQLLGIRVAELRHRIRNHADLQAAWSDGLLRFREAMAGPMVKAG
jgi:hypothetical protein